MDRPKVLFLCVGNSCRSQMAEALLRHHASDRFEAYSAGLDPKPIHPLTHRALHEISIDSSRQTSKRIEDFLGKMFVRYAILVCAESDGACPAIYSSAHNVLRWPFDDPASFEGSEREKLQEFRRVRDQIDDRIQSWLQELPAPIQVQPHR